MAFKRPTEGETIRADWWDADTYVILRPFISEALSNATAVASVKIPPGMSREEIKDGGVALEIAFTDAHAGRNVLLSGMVLSHTLRYEPTPAQVSAGEPGDTIPISDWWDCLPPDDYKVIEAALNARSGGVHSRVEADPSGDATFPDAPGADDAQLHGGLPEPA